MTLDRLIEYEENESKVTWNGKPTLCAEEHRQLAEWLKDYKRLLEQEPCEDCVDRQAVFDACDAWWWGNSKTDDLYEEIKALPPVTPKQSMVEKIKRLSQLYEKTFEWGCNDGAKELFADAVYACLHPEDDCWQECITEFEQYMMD